MDLNDVSDDDNLLAGLDMMPLTVQKDVTRHTVLASTVAMLRGLTVLFLAWLADPFSTTVVIGPVDGIVFIPSLLVTFINVKTSLNVCAPVQKATANHPGTEAHPAMEEHPAFEDSGDNDSS